MLATHKRNRPTTIVLMVEARRPDFKFVRVWKVTPVGPTIAFVSPPSRGV
jgi:hypothetical protein